jgi:hypothetical protein
MNLKNDVFNPVAKRVIDHRDSLRNAKQVSRSGNSGIEGWLKVEAAAALGDTLEAFQNKAPDLLLKGNVEIELKAATDLSPSWIIKNGSNKYNCPCLFIGDGQPQRIKRLRQDNRIDLVMSEHFSDGQNLWVIGIVVPKGYKPKGYKIE